MFIVISNHEIKISKTKSYNIPKLFEPDNVLIHFSVHK